MSKESIFNRSAKRKIATSYFDLSHNFGGTYYPGLIYPVFVNKVIPGDTWQIASSPFLRSQPAVSPLMSNVFCDIRYFYCRNQLVWKNFDMYITNSNKRGRGYLSPEDVPVHPFINYNSRLYDRDYRAKAFYDYMYGAVDPNSYGLEFQGLDALPARIYNMIWNEYYSNENYDKIATEYDGDGSMVEAAGNAYTLMPACYKKDYFTSMLPSPQRGDGVNLDAFVNLRLDRTVDHGQLLVDYRGDKALNDGALRQFLAGDVQGGTKTVFSSWDIDSTKIEDVYLDPNGTFGVTIDINDIRKASAVQRFLEKSAVNGNRYAEYMLSQFGVRIPDNSAYRPQYLGGGSQIINYSPVEQNSASGVTPQGNLAGRGTMRGLMGMNHRWFFTEPGWLMALMVIRPEALYAGGVNRQMYTNQDRFDDYVVPGFQNIGMQAVLRRELSAGVAATDKDEIGYQERYMEYKSIPSSVHGELISSMKSWFAIRDFCVDPTSDPVQINADFMHVQTDCLNDNTAVTGYPQFIVDIHHSIGVRRPLEYHAKYGGLV